MNFILQKIFLFNDFTIEVKLSNYKIFKLHNLQCIFKCNSSCLESDYTKFNYQCIQYELKNINDEFEC